MRLDDNTGFSTWNKQEQNILFWIDLLLYLVVYKYILCNQSKNFMLAI